MFGALRTKDREVTWKARIGKFPEDRVRGIGGPSFVDFKQKNDRQIFKSPCSYSRRLSAASKCD